MASKVRAGGASTSEEGAGLFWEKKGGVQSRHGAHQAGGVGHHRVAEQGRDWGWDSPGAFVTASAPGLVAPRSRFSS